MSVIKIPTESHARNAMPENGFCNMYFIISQFDVVVPEILE